MRLPGPLQRVEETLSGKPDAWLTGALLLTAAALVAVALGSSATGKALVLAWVLFP